MSSARSIPVKLPPRLEYSRFIGVLGKAHDALGRLDGLLTRVHNPKLLMSPLLTKEAVLSSRIEGTHASLEDVLKYEAAEEVSQVSEKEKDIREIVNYRIAMDTAIHELEAKPVGENLIKKLHSILLDSVRGAGRNRGNLRTVPVEVRWHPVKPPYIPPPVLEIPSLFSNWEHYVHSDQEVDSLVLIGVAHYQFEAIHPFMDGNGRIGRLLIPLLLYEKRFLSHPMLYISEYFEENRDQYFGLLNDVGAKGDWEAWISFFLEALRVQATKAQLAILEILKLYDSLKNKTAAVNSKYAISLLDIIFSTPFVTFSTIKKRMNANHQTIYNLLEKFVNAGILHVPSKTKRNRAYIFSELLQILQ